MPPLLLTANMGLPGKVMRLMPFLSWGSLALFVLLLIALSFYFFSPVLNLTVAHLENETEKPLLVIPVVAGDKFTIRYIHSVDRLPVYETFIVNDDHNLLLSEVRFIMLGAGMIDWGGELVYNGEWTILRNINRPVPSFRLRVSGIGEQTLLLKDKVVKLSNVAPESGILKFEIRRSPRVILTIKGGN